MFRPSSSFSVTGKALGLDITIDMTLRAEDADASSLVGLVRGDRPLLVDVPNIQTILISALNDALIRIQHMDAKVNGMSIQDVRIGRAKAPAPAEPAPYNKDTDGSLQ